MKNKVLKNNKFFVIGELVEYNLEVKADNEGREYISGDVVVKSKVKDQDVLLPIDFYSRAKKEDGTDNKLFNSYVALKDKVGQRVKIQGELRENRFFQEDTGQVISYTRMSGTFINNVRSNEEDKSYFTFVGYVVSPVSERLNQDGELIHHEIILAEENYSGEFPVYIKFSIESKKVAKTIDELYNKGDTVRVNGYYTVDVVEREIVHETAFGEPDKQVSVSSFRNIVITSGTYPLEEGNYSQERIAELDKAYTERGLQIEEQARAFDESTNDSTSIKRGIGRALL